MARLPGPPLPRALLLSSGITSGKTFLIILVASSETSVVPCYSLDRPLSSIQTPSLLTSLPAPLFFVLPPHPKTQLGSHTS